MSEPATHTFDDDGGIPNSRLAALVYHEVSSARDPSSAEQLFARNGWSGAWRNGIYSYHHFHSTAHEVLAVVAGSASVTLGGPSFGRGFEVSAGDVLVLPAGTGHCNEGSSDDFLVVGAYPGGMDWDLRRGDPAEHDEMLENIRRVPLPDADPIRGARGGLVGIWR